MIFTIVYRDLDNGGIEAEIRKDEKMKLSIQFTDEEYVDPESYKKYKGKEIEVSNELIDLVKDVGCEIIIGDCYIEIYNGYRE